MAKIEELLPVVSEEAPADDKDAVELSILSDVVIEYEKEHFPIEKPTVAELVELSLEEKNMTQKQLRYLFLCENSEHRAIESCQVL